MREMDAFEQAYKNGYAAGLKAAEEKIVRCKDCKWHKQNSYGAEGELMCQLWVDWLPTEESDFCSYGERRSDG